MSIVSSPASGLISNVPPANSDSAIVTLLVISPVPPSSSSSRSIGWPLLSVIVRFAPLVVNIQSSSVSPPLMSLTTRLPAESATDVSGTVPVNCR